MRLTTRLLLVILVCLLPTVTLGVIVQLDERTERRKELAALALRQAELLNADIGSIAETAHTLLVSAQDFPRVSALGPACGERLAPVARHLPFYVFIALFDPAGQLVCGSIPALREAVAAQPEWLREGLTARDFSVGRFATAPGIERPFVPFFMPVHPADASLGNGLLVAALDLDWLAAHLRNLKPLDSRHMSSSVLTVADRDGTILARSMRQQDFVGTKFPPAAMALVHATDPGTTRLASVDGTYRVIGYIPPHRSASGLMITGGLYEPDLMADLNRASLRGGLILAVVSIAALLATMVAGRKFIGRPTAQLVEAARRWREGDLSARVPVDALRSEFGQIASAFNAMAEVVEQREAELRHQADLLEARVSERTEELSKSYNRLQVEIAERQQTEASLVQAQKLQTVGQLAGGIAHDFNNLLATILGTLELLGRSLVPGESRQRTMIERASAAVQRGAQLTGRLLAFSRRRRLAVRPLDVNRLISELAALLATTTLGKRIRLVMALDPAIGPAMGESSQVEAAILNLALNARDAMPEGGVLTIATANVTLGPPRGDADPPAGDYVRIAVTDTGEGMSEEVSRRAFDPFFTTKGASGSGLGLSQVLGISRELGGAVQIDTSPGAGTTVALLLPKAAALPSAPQRNRPSGTLRRWRVLVVDDDAAVRHVTADMLQDLGLAVTEAQDACTAIAILEGDEVAANVVVTNYAMPGMSGLALTAKLRQSGFAGPIVLMTGYVHPNESDLQEETMPDAILQKPFTLDDLEDTLMRLQTERTQAFELQRAK